MRKGLARGSLAMLDDDHHGVCMPEDSQVEIRTTSSSCRCSGCRSVCLPFHAVLYTVQTLDATSWRHRLPASVCRECTPTRDQSNTAC